MAPFGNRRFFHTGGISRKRAVIFVVASVLIAGRLGSPIRTCLAQEEITSVRDLAVRGTVESLTGDILTIVDADGKLRRLRIQTEASRPIMLTGGSVPLNAPARIRVTGAVHPSALTAGMVIDIEGRLAASGQVDQVTRVVLQPPGSALHGLSLPDGPPSAGQTVNAKISAAIRAINKEIVKAGIPRDVALRRDQLKIDLTGVEKVEVDFGMAGMIRRGDIVSGLTASEVSTGDVVVRTIDVELVGLREDARLGVDDRLRIKYAHLPDEPSGPRDERSRNFLLRTDLSERRTAILLDKLETMLELVSDYYGRPLRQPIQCVVVENPAQWNVGEFPERAIGKIRNGEGMTEYRRIGRQQTAVVYSAANDAVVQHESVHGYCFLVFQTTGPLWYAEGMAEVGRFWEPENAAVHADPAILGFLRDSDPQPIDDILNETSLAGELWKPYAWRWALCHLLVNNPNYATSFHAFSRELMNGYKGLEAESNADAVAAFRMVFGERGRELNFEYRHMLANLNGGLRVDLCAWDWRASHKPLSPGKETQIPIAAQRGWQPVGVRVQPGETYQISASGAWRIDRHGMETSADGMPGSGTGRLVGVLMHDYRLSDEFELGTLTTWTAPAEGDLYLRCREPMAALDDNSGEIEATIKREH